MHFVLYKRRRKINILILILILIRIRRVGGGQEVSGGRREAGVSKGWREARVQEVGGRLEYQ
jgi:hypothetical protein